MYQQERKRGFAGFMEEKGLYMILFLGLAAIGLAGYFFFTEPETHADGGQTERASVTTAPMTTGARSETFTTPAFAPESRTSVRESEKPETTAASTAASTAETTARSSEPAAAVSPAYVKPVPGDVITAFSGGTLVYDRTTGDWRTHNGVDLAAGDGEDVQSIAAGTVQDVYYDSYYGTVVLIEHEDGVQSVYMGLQKEAAVEEGEKVAAGQKLGAVDAKVLFESALQPHVHLEVLKDGARTDPMELFS